MSELSTGTELLRGARKEDDAVLAEVHGDIDLHNSPELRVALLELIENHEPNRIVLDLAAVTYMDSSAIAVLVECLQKLRRNGGKLCLIRLQPRVRGLLEIARLDSIFILAEDEEQALRA